MQYRTKTPLKDGAENTQHLAYSAAAQQARAHGSTQYLGPGGNSRSAAASSAATPADDGFLDIIDDGDDDLLGGWEGVDGGGSRIFQGSMRPGSRGMRPGSRGMSGRPMSASSTTLGGRPNTAGTVRPTSGFLGYNASSGFGGNHHLSATTSGFLGNSGIFGSETIAAGLESASPGLAGGQSLGATSSSSLLERYAGSSASAATPSPATVDGGNLLSTAAIISGIESCVAGVKPLVPGCPVRPPNLGGVPGSIGENPEAEFHMMERWLHSRHKEVEKQMLDEQVIWEFYKY
jgi:hypothetical protein